jgi:hypothetical protein
MRTEQPLISVIIPTYQRPQLLRRAIRSVLEQTYLHLRVCVFDNASDEETAAAVADLAREDERIRYVRHEKNIGMTANFAYGMRRVETPFFAMLSDDDYYYPTFFEAAMEKFARYPDAALSAATTVIRYANGQMQIGDAVDGYFLPPDGCLLWTKGKGPAVTSMVFRKAVIDRVGVADERIFHWDLDYLWRVASRFPVATSSQPGLIFTIHTGQSTRVTAMETALQSYEAIKERVRGTPEISPPVRDEMERFLRAWFSQSVLYSGMCAIRDGDYARSRRAAGILRTHFGQEGRAAILRLVSTTCTRVPPLRWPTRLGLRALIRAGTNLHQSGRRGSSQDPLRAEIEHFVRTRMALSLP